MITNKIMRKILQGRREEKMRGAKEIKQQDRRIFERLPTRFAIRFIDHKRNREGNAEVVNFSAKGLRISGKVPLSPHTPLEMWLDIPDNGEAMYNQGEVAWSKLCTTGKWEAGIDLGKADPMGMSRICRVS